MSFTVSIGRDGASSDQTVKFHVGGAAAPGQGGQGPQNMRVRVGPGKPGGGMAITLGNPMSPRVDSPPGGAVAFKLGGQQRPQPEGMSYSPILTPTPPVYSGQVVGRQTPDGAVTVERAGTPMSDNESDAGGKMAQTYRSEIFIPIHKDELSFEDRQRSLWQDMDTRIEQRRMEWESEIQRMRTEFFSLKPLEMGSTRMGAIERTDNLQTAFEQGQDGTPRFKIRFDVQQFNTEEIKVQTFERRLIVKAKHTETRGNTTVSREFSRQVDLPSSVDVQSLQASVSKDGVLVVEAPVQTPSYQQIQHHQSPIPSLRSGPNTSPIVTNSDGSRQLKLEVEIGTQYTAEDVVVKTVDRKIVIHARHEEKSGNRTSFCEFSKEYELPESVDPFTVNAYLLDNGKLIVEAPLKSQALPPPPAPQSHRVTITVQRQ